MASSQAKTLKFSTDFNRLFAIYGVIYLLFFERWQITFAKSNIYITFIRLLVIYILLLQSKQKYIL